jgi:hypothetical protein
MTKKQNSPTITRSAVKELTEQIVRVAIQEQARSLEEHLQSIHKRLLALEKKR